jgi:hypothetical protein
LEEKMWAEKAKGEVGHEMAGEEVGREKVSKVI